MSIKNPLNPIKENGTQIKLNDYKIIELVCYQETKGGKDTNNILEKDLAALLFTCTKKLLSLSIVISILDIGNVGEYATHKTLSNIQQKLHTKRL